MITRAPIAVTLSALLTVALPACGESATPSAAPSASESKSAPAPVAEAPAKAPRAKGKWGGFPPEARRDTPPEGIFERALAEGASAPDFTLTGSTGAFTLTDALSKTAYVVLVFYRGAW